MRLSGLFAASTSIGAALAAELPIKGPFEIRVVDISNTSPPWATNIATVSHGAVILSLATGQPAQFTWSE
jgi:hypothetical protein